MTGYDLQAWLEMASHATVVGGVVWAAVQWLRTRDERRAAEARRCEAERQRSYAALNDHFLKFLELELRAPGLGTEAGVRDRVWEELSPAQRCQQRTLFDFLCSILERAFYFLNRDKVGEGPRPQWDEQEWADWDHWLSRYAQNENFVAFWCHLEQSGDDGSYGPAFVAHVRDAIARAKR